MHVCNNDSSDDDTGSVLECNSVGSRGGESDELDELTGKNHGQSHGGCGHVLANWIYNSRYILVIAWPVAAVIMAPFAAMLVINALPLPKTPPHGTPSMLAFELFEAKFPFLVGMKMEMISLTCRSYCATAVSTTSKAYVQELKDLVKQFGHAYPETIIDIRSYYTFGTKIEHNPMISFDKQKLLMVFSWRVNGTMKLTAQAFAKQMSEKIWQMNKLQDPDTGPETYDIAATGPTFLNLAMKETILHEVPVHEILTLWMPFGILAYRLRSVRLLLLALCSMPISILTSFGVMYFVSLHLPVIMYALVMMLMLCTALSFDYSLFTMTRFTEERELGAGMKEAIMTVITQSGHVVVVSGLVLTIAYGAMLVLPGAFKSFCVAACTMILASLGVQMTFVPCLLAIFPWLGAGFEPPAQKSWLSNASPKPSQASFRSEGVDISRNSFGKDSYGGSPREASKFGFTPHDFLDQDGHDVPDHKNPMKKVAKFREGIYYWMGGKLTQFPTNVLVPLVVYAVMTPLTLRMRGYKMGHAYELQIPRGREEWTTSLEIQRNFPTSVGCMMPTLIIATNRLPAGPPPANAGPPPANVVPQPAHVVPDVSENVSEVTELPGFPKPDVLPDTSPVGHSNVTRALASELSTSVATTPGPLDVRGQAFFEANCEMVNTLIQATKNKTYALKSSDFQSATFYGENANGDVKCLNYRLTHYYRANFFTQKFMFTSQLMQKLWDQLVSDKHDAMLTLLTPKMDPFSEEAFLMTNDIRRLLQNATEDAKSLGFEGVTYKMFSPSAIMMDMIKVTNDRLPIAFLGCALVCFTLIAIAFGAALIPFKLLFTVILPITWAYGAALYVYEDGVLEWIGFPGLAPTYITHSGPAGLDWTVPMFTLTIMLGLALDYDVFLFERVWEFREEGFGDNESIQLALSATGPTISAAGMIFALTFVAMMLGSMAITNQMGFIFVFSIVVDTFIVRTVLVPSMLSLNPCLNYWPSKMPEPRHLWIGTDREKQETFLGALGFVSPGVSRGSRKSRHPESPLASRNSMGSYTPSYKGHFPESARISVAGSPPPSSSSLKGLL